MIDKRSGKIAYAVMSFGGLLGIGNRYHPLPWSTLKYDTRQGGHAGWPYQAVTQVRPDVRIKRNAGVGRPCIREGHSRLLQGSPLLGLAFDMSNEGASTGLFSSGKGATHARAWRYPIRGHWEKPLARPEFQRYRDLARYQRQRPYQRPRPYQPPPPSNKTRRTIMRSVVMSISMVPIECVLARCDALQLQLTRLDRVGSVQYPCGPLAVTVGGQLFFS